MRFSINDFSIKKQAEDLGVSVWQTPGFLFLLMGIITVAVMAAVYVIASNYDSPELLVISECVVVAVIMTIGNFIIQSVEQVAKANKMKTEFVSIASHQLKTPLSQVNWEVELLLSCHRQGLNDNQMGIIKTISSSNSKMIRLVNDLLDVARIDQGKLAFFKEKFEIIKLIADIANNNSQLAEKHKVIIQIKKPNSHFQIVEGDRRRIGVAIDNLLSNAIKYSMPGDRAELSAEKKGTKIVVCVKDNGLGIPCHQQNQVFQKFFRSDNSARYQEDGTGLGLYIAKNIVEQSGGKIWFNSEENKGSEFCFSLPLK